MAKIETYFDCDLKKAVQVQPLNGNVFSLDNNGNRIGVRIFDNGVKTTVTGTVTGRAILADNSTVNLNGGLTTVNGQSVAYVDVLQGALLIPGTIKITIQLTASGVITTLAAILSTVYQTKTDNVITPSAQVIADWNAEISSAIQTQNATIASAIATQDAQISDLKSAINNFESFIFDNNNLFDTSVPIFNNNTAIVNNNDGTYTIGTTDYGYMVFGPVTLKAGLYLLYGVPRGASYISRDGSSLTIIVKNTTSDPKSFVLDSTTTIYLAYTIGYNPPESFVVTPFLYKPVDLLNINTILDLYNFEDWCLLNAIDYDNYLDGKYYGANGVLMDSSAYKYSVEYIRIKPSTKYSSVYSVDKEFPVVFSTNKNIAICFYDVEKNFISQHYNISSITSPANAYYIRISIQKDYSYKCMIYEDANNSLPDKYHEYGYQFNNEKEIKQEIDTAKSRLDELTTHKREK